MGKTVQFPDDPAGPVQFHDHIDAGLIEPGDLSLLIERAHSTLQESLLSENLFDRVVSYLVDDANACTLDLAATALDSALAISALDVTSVQSMGDEFAAGATINSTASVINDQLNSLCDRSGHVQGRWYRRN